MLSPTPEAHIAERTVQSSFTDRPANGRVQADKEPSASKQLVAATAVDPIAETSLQGQQKQTKANSDTPEKQLIAETTAGRSGSTLEEFKNWKVEEEKKRGEEAKEKELREKEAARAEAEQIDKLRPMREKIVRDTKIREDIEKKRNVISSRRKDDKIYKIYGDIADVYSPDYRGSCKFMPDVAAQILKIYRSNHDGFARAALDELNKSKMYINHDVVYDFMAQYVINTLNGDDDIKRNKLIDVINGKTFSTLCYLYGSVPNRVQRTNDDVVTATKNMNESFEAVSIDYSEPYYGLLCARFAAENKRSIINRNNISFLFESKSRDLNKVEPNIAEFFLFYRKNTH